MPASNRPARTSDPSLDKLRAYTFHGVHLSLAGHHAVGDCPFCGHEGKFSVDVATTLGRCFVCGVGTTKGGVNPLVFTRLIHEYALAGHSRGTSGRFLAAVASDRRLLDPATVAAWGVAQARDGTWLVPGYNTEGRLDQVYRRTKVLDKGEWVWKLLPTPEIGWAEGKSHALNLPLADFDPKRPIIDVFEGPWDGMAAWEAKTALIGVDDTNIVAVPGCNVWRDDWTELCRGKQVRLWFDSDHPKEYIPGKVSRPGYDGMVRIAKRLSGVAASVRYLRWGPDGYNVNKPSGWDIRDCLSGAGNEKTARILVMIMLKEKVEDAPREWFNPSTPIINGYHVASVESLSCSTLEKCEGAWKEAMRWRTDLSDALAVLLAVCASTQQAGNQLFLDLVGSAGSGKTTLCEGLLVSSHCHHLEHLTGFHSGWKMADDQGKDCSLIARINGKTLITPEFDVMRASPRYPELMAQQRRIFDGKSGATYKNSDKDTLHVGLRTPWIRAGTPAIMDTDQASMGDRFMRLIISDPTTEEEKRAIMRAALRSERVAILERANGTAGGIVDPKTREAHGVTGGYVDWLRAHIEEELPRVEVSDSAEEYCMDLADLSADLRARPNEDKRKLETHDTKELPTRLARQNIRLASCLAVVFNKPSVDADVLRIVRKVALDTASGHSLNMVRWFCSANPRAEYLPYQECGGLATRTLEMWANMTPERLAKYLAFLRKIGVIDWHEPHPSHGAWVLTERVYSLYKRVMNG